MNPRDAPLRKRFVLSGHSAVLDPVTHALRDDLADVELADRVFAPHYAHALICTVTKVTTAYISPDCNAATVDELAVGAVLDLFDVSAGWGWVRTAKCVGYVCADCIVPL